MAQDETVRLQDFQDIDGVNDLWAITVDIWQHGFMGVDLGKIFTAILIFGVFLLARGLFSRYVLDYLHKWTNKTKTTIDDTIVDALIPPIKFIPIILGIFFSFNYAGLNEVLGDVFDRGIRTLITFTMFWGIYRATTPLSQMLRGLERMFTATMVRWIFKILQVLVLFVGAAVILEIWGIAVGPLLAGLGLFGAAVALGAQDLFKNLIGGVTVIAEKRFFAGDWIRVDGIVEGTVEDIGFRSTLVRRFDKAPVHVPNAQLSDAALTNFSRMTHRRIYWTVGVEYRSSVEQLKIIRDGIMEYLHENDAFDTNVTTFVRIDAFGASSIDILIYCFTRTTVWGEWLEIKENLAFEIIDIVENTAGTSFAFPSQSIYIENFPGDRPEPFVPPERDVKPEKDAA